MPHDPGGGSQIHAREVMSGCLQVCGTHRCTQYTLLSTSDKQQAHFDRALVPFNTKGHDVCMSACLQEHAPVCAHVAAVGRDV